jgi:type IV fimbrial biogenesis protein FimT
MRGAAWGHGACFANAVVNCAIPPSPAAAPRFARTRGFTLIELLTVVIIIAVLAGLAMPSFNNIMSDRRVNRAAMEAAEMYRLGRTRALGHGAAILVRWVESGGAAGKGLLEMQEANLQTNGGLIIPNSANCFDTVWTNGDPSNRHVTSFQPGRGMYELVEMTMTYPDGTQVPSFDICFTPKGRTFFRLAANGNFVELTGVPTMVVKNTRTGLLRRVLVPPNGVARLAL